jgi:hypothetical protein
VSAIPVKVTYPSPTLLLPGVDVPGSAPNIGVKRPTFTWAATSGATGYTIQVSKVSDFSSTVVSANATNATYTLTTSFSTGTTYYWRVRINGTYGPSAWSVTFSFTTQ